MKIKIKLISLLAPLILSATGVMAKDQSYYLIMPIKGLVYESAPVTGNSCKSILDSGNSTGNGVYKITPNGGSAIDVYCDMTTSGGGWTMVVAQFELDLVINWNEGIQADYDPTLASSRGFALNTNEIPVHSETAFGKSLDPTFIGYSSFIYSTGDIAKYLLTNSKTAESYHVHRNTLHYYSHHNPESVTGNSSIWNNTLTYDKTGGNWYSWAFSAQHSTPSARGYSISGVNLNNSSDTFAWTVWVR